MDPTLAIALFWSGFVLLIIGLTLRIFFPKWDNMKSEDKEKLFENTEDPNGN